MAWTASSGSLASQSFYRQDDSGWCSQPQINVHTPLGKAGSVFHWTGSPAKTRTVSGLVTSEAAYDAIVAAAQAGAATTFGAENVIIQQVQGRRRDVANLAYLSLVTVHLYLDEAPA